MIPLLLLAATPVHQDLPALDRAVAAFTGHAVGEDGGPRAPVDPRLRLASCPMVALSWRSEARDAVVATCTGPGTASSWRVFVPVRRVAAAGTAAPAVATAPAPARVEPVVRRGDPVLIEAGDASFSITREGIAAGDAAPGARLLVRVDGSPRPVQAVAVAAGRVALPGQ